MVTVQSPTRPHRLATHIVMFVCADCSLKYVSEAICHFSHHSLCLKVAGIFETRLWAGHSGVHIPGGCSPKCSDQLLGPPSLLFIGYIGSFLGVKWPGQMTTHLHLVLRLRISGAIPLVLLYALMVWRRIIFLFCSFMLDIGNVGDGFLEFTQKQSH